MPFQLCADGHGQCCWGLPTVVNPLCQSAQVTHMRSQSRSRPVATDSFTLHCSPFRVLMLDVPINIWAFV